jgi:hypothetical protein
MIMDSFESPRGLAAFFHALTSGSDSYFDPVSGDTLANSPSGVLFEITPQSAQQPETSDAVVLPFLPRLR